MKKQTENKQEKIWYRDIINLGFTEEFCTDNVYFNQYGYEYAIINKELTKRIYLDWEKETGLCKLVRIDNPKKCNIKAEMPIYNLQHLKEVIDFYLGKKYDFDINKAC